MSRPKAGVVLGTLGRGGQPSLLAEIKTYIFNLCSVPACILFTAPTRQRLALR